MAASPEVIRSRTNPLIKRASKALAGHDHATIVLEGERLLDDALRCGVPLDAVLVGESAKLQHVDLTPVQSCVRVVADEVLARVSDLETSPGVLGIGPVPESDSLERLARRPDAFLLVIAGVANPGNLGALLRSAEAFGVTGVVVLSGRAHPFGPKALRGSMGSALRIPLATQCAAAETKRALDAAGVHSLVARTRGGAPVAEQARPLALWVGAETGDLPAAVDAAQGVTLEIAASVESLNATVATSILLYALSRAVRES